MINLVIYIIATSFQISGTLLLLLNFTSTKRENIIKQFSTNYLINRDNNKNKIEYDKTRLKALFRNAWLNKISFASLGLGYILGILGEPNHNYKFLTILCIIILAITIMSLSYLIVACIIKYSSQVNKKLTNDELIELGIQPHIESISNKDIDDMFTEIFK